MDIECILLGLLLMGIGVYIFVCPEKMWKIVIYFRSLRWPNREPMESELSVTRVIGGGLVLLGLLISFGYI